ncbi:MAG: SprT family zinc-dependent metalloprotease [Ignavibacteriaceae bacterium]
MGKDYSSISINGIDTKYIIRRSNRAKYLRIQILHGELQLVVPKNVSISDAKRFLNEKRQWIEKHLNPSVTKPSFTLFGKTIKVVHQHDMFLDQHHFIFRKNVLIITSPQNSTLKTAELFNIWLRHSANKYITARTGQLADDYGFHFRSIKIRGQKTRWGSCSGKGNLSFNYKLMQYPKRVIDYVIVHELCHLKEMNHSQRFWKLVGEILPDYKILKNELRKAV